MGPNAIQRNNETSYEIMRNQKKSCEMIEHLTESYAIMQNRNKHCYKSKEIMSNHIKYFAIIKIVRNHWNSFEIM